VALKILIKTRLGTAEGATDGITKIVAIIVLTAMSELILTRRIN
jgi:hypothetical protein